MFAIKNNIKEYLIKRNRNHWEIRLPFIAPEHIVFDIEQILETHRKNHSFKLELFLIPEFPISIEEYHEHEKSVRNLFRKIIACKYIISMFTLSGMNHYPILNGMQPDSGYEYFTSDDFIAWEHFFDKIIIIDASLFYSYNLTYVGVLIPKHISLVMEASAFHEINSEISDAYFEFEDITKGVPPYEISAYSVKIPIGSIIHMILKP